MKTILVILCAPLLAAAAGNAAGPARQNAPAPAASAAATPIPPPGAGFGARTAGPGAGCRGQAGAGWGRRGFGPARGGAGWAACALNLTAATRTTLTPDQLSAGCEEERAAHDLYVLAADTWQLPVFRRIALAEDRHGSALATLAGATGVMLPAAVVGTYGAPDIQAQYDSLRPMILESPDAALRAAALVEETDIAGLRKLLAGGQDATTQALLTRLEAASRNHLVAFVRNLAARGAAYQPKVLTPEDFAAIVGG